MPKPTIHKGDRVITTHGPGIVEHFECFPSLLRKEHSIFFSDLNPSADSEEARALGIVYYRIGVSGTGSSVKPVAYFMPYEVEPHDDVIECALCGKRMWFGDSWSPGDDAICSECDTEVTGRSHEPSMNPDNTLPPWNG